MRILLVGLNARLIGGLEICSRDVALSLRRLGHQVSVISALDPPQEFTGWADVPIRTLAPQNPILFRLYIRAWRRMLAGHLRRVRQEYDLVLVMHPYAAISAHQAEVPHYWTWTYGVEVWDEWTPWLRKGLEKSHRVVAISAHTCQAVQKQLPGSSLSIVHPIVDTARFVPEHPPHDPTPPFRLLTVGRLAKEERYKGHERVIRNLKAIQDRVGATVEYWIAGDGNDRPSLEDIAHIIGLSRVVHFLGRVLDDQLVSIYQKCDVFVMPSMREGFGIVYLEASACDKPVVGGNVGGAVDAIQDGVTGFCIDPASDFELVEAVSTLLLNPTLARQMGQAGRQRVEAGFSSQALDDQLAGLLEHH